MEVRRGFPGMGGGGSRFLTGFSVAFLLFFAGPFPGPPPSAAGGRSTPGSTLSAKPPRVKAMKPENGATGVDPKLDRILITFSEPMRDRSWSVCGGGEDFPRITSIRYTKGCTVLEIGVALEPGRTYRFRLNSPSYKNFVSRKGVPLEPVSVTFTTRGKRPGKGPAAAEPAKSPPVAPPGRIAFELADAAGVIVKSGDYKGVPLFILFGAAW